jgi:hypothetical protein
MLRVYGVVSGSNVANDTDVPPAVVRYVPPGASPAKAIATTPAFTG